MIASQRQTPSKLLQHVCTLSFSHNPTSLLPSLLSFPVVSWSSCSVYYHLIHVSNAIFTPAFSHVFTATVTPPPALPHSTERVALNTSIDHHSARSLLRLSGSVATSRKYPLSPPSLYKVVCSLKPPSARGSSPASPLRPRPSSRPCKRSFPHNLVLPDFRCPGVSVTSPSSHAGHANFLASSIIVDAYLVSFPRGPRSPAILLTTRKLP